MNNHLGFRLHSLRISGHPVLKDVQFVFCDDLNTCDNVYVTGIIGSNGTGKSHLMSAIATVFSEVYKAKLNGNTGSRRFTFEIDYYLFNDHYQMSNSHKTGKYIAMEFYNRQNYVTVIKNGLSIDLADAFLPDRVIASTMTVTDKFVAKSDEFYKYRGIRNENSVNTTGTRTLIRKAVSSIMSCMSSKNAFQNEMRILLDNLGLEQHLHIKYGMRYKSLFLRNNMSIPMFKDIFDNWEDHFIGRGNAPWGYNHYLRIREDNQKLDCIVKFLIKHAMTAQGSVVVSYDVMQAPEEFHRDAEAILLLSQLDIMTFPTVEVVKKGMLYGLENSSSGETHLLCQFIGIMADIRQDSLILIDEPENSSHPDWQMNYVGWLKEIFKDYRSCHFIITTHSPLLLTNMKPTESTILRLKRNDDGKIISEGDFTSGCFSWNVDEILKDVMDMKKSHPDEYNVAMRDFENALRINDKRAAKDAYHRLEMMINPSNVLLELLRIQMIGVDDD